MPFLVGGPSPGLFQEPRVGVGNKGLRWGIRNCEEGLDPWPTVRDPGSVMEKEHWAHWL